MDSPIDEKMDKFSLIESPLHLDASVKSVISIDDAVPAVDASGGKDDGISMTCTVEALKGDGIGDVCLVSNDLNKVDRESEEDESNESEDDPETSSSSSNESVSSSSEEEDDVKVDDDVGKKSLGVDKVLGLEEGEIRDPNEEEMVMWSDEDVEVVKGPIKSKHEIKDLPPVPQVEAILEPHHQTLSVGVISSILAARVIVEGSEKHNPLSEGSVLWITETRSPLGLVDEIFGPVKSPYYIVRYNSDSEVPAGIDTGTAVSFVADFANHILEKELNRKGYDASNENDEEVTDEEEFSDDEKEAEYRRSLKQSKRAASDARRGKQETAFDKRTNFKGGLASERRLGNQESKTNFEDPQQNSGWRRNQEPAVNMRTNFQGLPSRDGWQGNQQCAMDKRSNFSGAMEPPPLPSVPGSFQTPTAFGTNPAMSAGITQPMQFGTCFTNSPQQLLLQQMNAFMVNAMAPQQLQMVPQGGYPTNAMPGQQVVGGRNHQPHHHQNQAFNPFSNAMPHQQQFVPNVEPTVPSQQVAVDMIHQPHHQNQAFNGFPNAVPQQQQFLGNVGPAVPSQQVVGDMTHQPHHQNQGFNGFPNTVPFQQQFVPNVGPAANLPWLGGFLNQSLGVAGQSNVSQDPFRPGSFNAHRNRHPLPAVDQGGMRPLQYNPSIRPSVNQGGAYPMQFNPSAGPTPVGAAGQPGFSQALFGHSNVPEQGASGSANAENPQKNQFAITNQGGMHQPMQFNSSINPTSLACGDMQERGPSGSHDSDWYGQPLGAMDQGRVLSPMQFNPGRSSFRGRNPNQRGGRLRFSGRGGQSQNR